MATLISLAEYKAYAGITGTATDAQLTAIISQASTLIRRLCGRDLVTGFESTQRTENVSGNGTQYIRVREWPVTAVASVSQVLDDGSLSAVPSNTYRVVENGYGVVMRLGSVPGRYGGSIDYTYFPNQFATMPQWVGGVSNFRFVYTGGYATIPDDLKYVACQIVGMIQANAGASGAFDSESLGQYSYTRGDGTGAASMVKTIAAMLAPWRVGT